MSMRSLRVWSRSELRPAARAALPACCAALLWLIACDRRPTIAFAPPPPPEVTVARPITLQIEDTLDFTGLVRGLETVELRARVTGFLQKKHFTGGERVRQGDPVFTIDPRTYRASFDQAEATLAARQADLRLAEVTAERVTLAADMNAASKQERDQAVAQREAAKAMVELAQATLESARLDLEFTVIKAPIDGRLSIVNLDEGALVGATDATLLGTIINDARVYAYYDIDEATLLDLRRRFQNRRPGEDGRLNLPIRLQQAGEIGYPHLGEFARADNIIDSQTGTIRVEAIFDNPGGAILPGGFVRVRPVFGKVAALLLPDTAVLTDQGGRYVYALDADGKAQRRNVRVGQVYGQMRHIRDGLSTDDRVIVNGLQRVRSDQKVTPTLTTLQPPELEDSVINPEQLDREAPANPELDRILPKPLNQPVKPPSAATPAPAAGPSGKPPAGNRGSGR